MNTKFNQTRKEKQKQYDLDKKKFDEVFAIHMNAQEALRKSKERFLLAKEAFLGLESISKWVHKSYLKQGEQLAESLKKLNTN